MRRIAILLTASAALLLAGAFAFTADAMTGSGALGLRTAAKNFSPIDTVACRVAGPVCGLGRTWVCRPLRGCWCARCRW
jgi:hypothetical protein